MSNTKTLLCLVGLIFLSSVGAVLWGAFWAWLIPGFWCFAPMLLIPFAIALTCTVWADLRQRGARP